MNQFVKIAAAAAVSLVFLSGCSDPVSTVKDGTLPEFSTSMKVGDALGKYSGCVEKTAKWSKFSTDQIKSGVEFTCELKPSAELYAGIRKEAVDAKSGVQVLQAMADAFRAALGDGASQQLDMSKNIDTMIAATGVTKNELTVRFAINSDDKKKFDLSSVSTKFFWGKDSANLRIRRIASTRFMIMCRLSRTPQVRRRLSVRISSISITPVRWQRALHRLPHRHPVPQSKLLRRTEPKAAEAFPAAFSVFRKNYSEASRLLSDRTNLFPESYRF